MCGRQVPFNAASVAHDGSEGREMPTSRSVILEQDVAKRTPVANGDGFRVHKIRWQMTLAGIVLIILAAVGAEAAWRSDSTHAAAPPPSPPRVTVSFPLQDTVANMTVLLGQFSAVIDPALINLNHAA